MPLALSLTICTLAPPALIVACILIFNRRPRDKYRDRELSHLNDRSNKPPIMRETSRSIPLYQSREPLRFGKYPSVISKY